MSEKKAKASPTAPPWQVSYFSGDHGRATIEQARTDRTKPYRPVAAICELYGLGGYGELSDEARANGDLIVAAVNAIAAAAAKLPGKDGKPMDAITLAERLQDGEIADMVQMIDYDAEYLDCENAGDGAPCCEKDAVCRAFREMCDPCQRGYLARRILDKE